MNGAEFLKSKGITQAQLAQAYKCRINNVNIWFSGSHSPTVRTITRLTDTLNELGANTTYNEVFNVLFQSRKEYLEKKNLI